MSDVATPRAAILRPAGEPVPLLLWLDAAAAAVAADASALGATVVAMAAGTVEPPTTLIDALAQEHRARFGRCYLVHARHAPVAAVHAGVPGTRLHDADPWAVALVAGALRDAGCGPEPERGARGGGTTDELQGFTIEVPEGQGACIAAVVAALADGLRVSKC